MMTGSGPALVHSSDFSLVTAAKPAHSAELLSLFAAGLGPTRPGVDSGRAFPASALQPVNSPVEVTVNGNLAEVLYAGGYPGAVERYRVNFKVRWHRSRCRNAPPDLGLYTRIQRRHPD